MKKFYLHDDSGQQGPFDVEDLRVKNLTKNTPIWYDGISHWTTAGNVEELRGFFTTTPPPFATKMVTPPPVNNTEKQQAHKSKRNNLIGRRLLILTCTVVLVLIGVFVYNQIQSQQRQNYISTEEDVKARIRNNITSYVTAERSEYTYSKLGGIFDLKISVANNTDYLIDNVRIRVIYIKADGDVWDSRIIDFNLLNPQTKSTIKVPDTQRGTSVKHEIVSIKSTSLGLN